MSAEHPERLLARRSFVGGSLLALAMSRAFAQGAGSINSRMQGDFAPVHDPCIIKQADTYYLFCTTSRGDAGGFVACRRSRDLVNWEKSGFVFAQVPEWALVDVPGSRGIWAPDISFFNDIRLQPLGHRPGHQQDSRPGGCRFRVGR